MKIFNSVLFILIPIFSYSQNAYNDAVKLRSAFQVGEDTIMKGDSVFILIPDIDEVYQILSSYTHSAVSPISKDSILSAFASNPFMRINPNQTHGSISELVSKGISSVGNLDVTSIADGLARFLIKRGKEELNIAFFQRLKEFLESHIEAKTLFPSTVEFLDRIASYRYAEFLPSLRESFYKDINSLVVNLNLLIDLPKYQDLLKALPEIRVAVRSAKIISELSQPGESMHPANLISHLASLTEWGEMNINLAGSWKVLDKISESVRRNEIFESKISQTLIAHTDTFVSINKKISEELSLTEPVKILAGQSYTITKTVSDKRVSNEIAWIKFSDFNNDILRDSITLKIYLGLLYQKMDSIAFRNAKGDVTTVQDFMKDNKDNIFKIADLVENFLVLANSVESSIKDIKQHGANAITKEEYYTYISKAINVVEYGFKVANTIEAGIADDRYIVMARNANNLYKNIYSKDYNAAIMNAYLILDEIFSKSNEAIAEKQAYFSNTATMAANVHSVSFQKNSIAFNKDLNTLNQDHFLTYDSIDTRSKIVEDILKYGNVIASIVKAESPEEAAAAIEAAALPAGSSSIKKNSRFNISLNAYIGGSYSNYTNNTDKIDGSNSKVGVTAPVGIAFSWGLGHYNTKAGRKVSIGALSAYLTIIDVGAIAGYRLTNDSTELEQKVTIDDIFTPGGYLVYGIGGLPFLQYIPLSIGYGWQYGSKLYYKNSTGTLATSDKSRWRQNFFIGIDIPLTNFWTKGVPKKD